MFSTLELTFFGRKMAAVIPSVRRGHICVHLG